MADSIDRMPGDPYPYQVSGTGKWFWKRPGEVVVNGPFLTLNDALDDIVEDNVARIDALRAQAGATEGLI